MSKISNSIIIGGPIAVGKSTLVKSLPFIPIRKLDLNDELQDLLLHKMYEGNKIAQKIFQIDMLLTRFDKYKKMANNKKMHVFDRSIFEDIFFAQNLFQNKSNIWNCYKAIWNDKVEEIITKIGKPKFYILLICSWDVFKKRLFNRNCGAEIDNFQKNKKYFQHMIQAYEKYMINIFKTYDLDYIIINTNHLSKLEVVEKVKKKIKEKGIL